jgi:hypothetical protein
MNKMSATAEKETPLIRQLTGLLKKQDTVQSRVNYTNQTVLSSK